MHKYNFKINSLVIHYTGIIIIHSLWRETTYNTWSVLLGASHDTSLILRMIALCTPHKCTMRNCINIPKTQGTTICILWILYAFVLTLVSQLYNELGLASSTNRVHLLQNNHILPPPTNHLLNTLLKYINTALACFRIHVPF